MAMSSPERVRAALCLSQPDRVPIAEFCIDERVARAAVPECVDAPDAMDKLGIDMVCCGAQFDVVKTADDGAYWDEWGVMYRAGGPEMFAAPVSGPIKTYGDAEAYQPPNPHTPQRLAHLRELVQRYKGTRAIGFHHRAAFMWAAYLMGLDKLLMAMAADQGLAELVMDKVLEANIEVVRGAIRAGAEVIILGDDYAYNSGPMMSPKMFEELILPRLRKMIEMIHAEGALCIKHTDGDIYKLLDMIVDADPDGLNPIEPAAGMDLRSVKERVGDRVCLIGNIDCAHLLPFGTPQQVREAVRQAIEDAGEGGRFMISSSNSIHSSCKAENLVAMVEAAKEFGLYE